MAEYRRNAWVELAAAVMTSGGAVLLAWVLSDRDLDWLAYFGGGLVLVGVLLMAAVLSGRLGRRDDTPAVPAVPTPAYRPPRIGVRLRGGTGNFPRARIHGMDTAIDAEDADVRGDDMDIR